MENSIVKKYDEMTISQIEGYGSDIQLKISDGMSKMLENTKCIDLESTGKSLSDLSIETGNLSKRLSSIQRLPHMLKASKFVARYDNIENRVLKLEEGGISRKRTFRFCSFYYV